MLFIMEIDPLNILLHPPYDDTNVRILKVEKVTPVTIQKSALN